MARVASARRPPARCGAARHPSSRCTANECRMLDRAGHGSAARRECAPRELTSLGGVNHAERHVRAMSEAFFVDPPRETTKLSSQFDKSTRRANHPKVRQSPSQKYSDFQKSQISLYPSHPVPPRGAFRERHERGAGMRWTRRARDDERRRSVTVEIVWSRQPRRWCQLAEAILPRRRWQEEPGRRGEPI